MIVAGLRLEASPSRSRSWPSDQRLPAPARPGARSPWNFCSGNGPLWQRMQVLVRSTTSARPRVASPGMPVSDSGMASPTTTYARNPWAPAAPGRANVAATSHIRATGMADLTKSFHRDCLEPGLRFFRFLHANFARRIDRAGAATFDLGEYSIPGLIDAGQRERKAGRDRIVAGAHQPRHCRRYARDQARHRSSACLSLRIRGGCGFGDGATNAGVADDVNVGHELRRKRNRIDRAPAGIVGRARDVSDAAGLLRWNDVCHLRSVVAPIGDDRVFLGI